MALYDRLGRTYATTRREDPRIAAAIHPALGDARRVVNVGAGTGAYEPRDREVVAVEPSPVMIAQRPAGAAPVVRATAEELPFADAEFDAAMAILTVHHWADLEAGIAELRRVARRIVILSWDQATTGRFWLVRDYLPEVAASDSRAPTTQRLVGLLGGADVTAVPVPHDCADGFMAAWWRRPAAYLDPEVRAGISSLSLLEGRLDAGLGRLARDLSSGRWHERYADLLELEELDAGYRLIVSRG
jgi:SAM-dependent methyltransferase